MQAIAGTGRHDIGAGVFGISRGNTVTSEYRTGCQYCRKHYTFQRPAEHLFTKIHYNTSPDNCGRGIVTPSREKKDIKSGVIQTHEVCPHHPVTLF
jgi:hypothetical protein